MARMKNDDGQWIVLMGFIVSVSILFLAFIMSKATVVGQTTSEGVLEFPKSEIQDLRSELINITKDEEKGGKSTPLNEKLRSDIRILSLARKNAVINATTDNYKYIDLGHDWGEFIIHYNDGVTIYDETYLVPVKSH